MHVVPAHRSVTLAADRSCDGFAVAKAGNINVVVAPSRDGGEPRLRDRTPRHPGNSDQALRPVNGSELAAELRGSMTKRELNRHLFTSS